MSGTGQSIEVDESVIAGKAQLRTMTREFCREVSPEEVVRATMLLVAARTEAGVALFAVDAAEPGMSREPLSTMDLTREQASVELTDVPGRLIADEAEAPEVLKRALQVAQALLAVEQVGGSQRMLDVARYALDSLAPAPA